MIRHEVDPAERSPSDGPGPDVAMAPVVLLRPIRTLVVARDLGFRQRAVTILGELGSVAFAVVSLDDVAGLIERERADVVVLDATACADEVPRVLCALHAINPRVGVVVVSDQPERAIRATASLQKWGWAADLSAAVMHAYRHGNPLQEPQPDACS